MHPVSIVRMRRSGHACQPPCVRSVSGVGRHAICGADRMGRRRPAHQAQGMTEDRLKSGDAEPLADAIPSARTGRLVLTSAEYAALAQELELLRSRHRAELEERLRVARGFGVSSDNDDLLAVMEDAAVDEARIAQLEDELRTARVVDAEYTCAGTAGLSARRWG